MWGVFQLSRNPRQFEKILYGERSFSFLLLDGTYFNSGSPCVEHFSEDIIIVSIHALQVGSTGQILADWKFRLCFNSRSPCGEYYPKYRQRASQSFVSIHVPCGGNICLKQRQSSNQVLSIHAPRAGSTGKILSDWRSSLCFNSRSLYWEHCLKLLDTH